MIHSRNFIFNVITNEFESIIKHQVRKIACTSINAHVIGLNGNAMLMLISVTEFQMTMDELFQALLILSLVGVK